MQILKENIIDSNAAWTKANVVTSLQIKKIAKHIHCLYSISKCTERWDFVFKKKKKKTHTHKAYGDYWLACVQWMDLKMLSIISKHLQHN